MAIIIPDTMADADAQNNTIYYSTDKDRLVYKDKNGVVKVLYPPYPGS